MLEGVSERVRAVPPIAVRGAFGAVIALVALELGLAIAIRLGALDGALALVLGGLVPLALAALQVVGAITVVTGAFDARETVTLGAWYLGGLVVALAVALAAVVRLGVGPVAGLGHPIVLGNMTGGALGGLFVGLYAVRSQRRAADLATERARLASEHEQLVLLNRIVRHDVANHLQVIAGVADHLDGRVDPEAESAVARLQRTTDDAIELTDRMRKFVDVFAGDADRDRRAIDLGRVLSTQVENSRDVFPHAEIRLGPYPDVDVWADELLSTIYHNLITNAIKHNDGDPTVEISGSVTDDRVRVRIADDGPGVEPGRMEGLLDREFAPEESGEGVGLYLVATLVAHYDGDVWVERNDPRGSVFVVELPVADAINRGDEASVAERSPTNGT
ncbi:sensor histidine kinase [Halococcoides cellulosivorans]|uniref:histidine kinase n=1 Tax=Halococcoides cellulosivorans TaxID=1679096 RepID=A0A2R4WZ69_9EURY|nr:ATP-binding protein [Halococcoides cellulosivorans]AWB26837.1 histidine kinase [Halococcoides cellulosivorans]